MRILYDTIDYTFQLPVFEGPLDLLLRLIEREELDITSVALAQVADQYLAHVRALEAPDPAALSAFLTIAARLLLIKSRALLPRPPAPPPEGELDEGEALAQQLREYQRFKQAASFLRMCHEQGRRMYTRVQAPALPLPRTPERLDVSLNEMIAALQRRMQLLLPLEEPALPLPAPKIITVAEMTARIRAHLIDHDQLEFDALISSPPRRVEVIVAFWSVLELLKRHVVVVEQASLFGPIAIARGPHFFEAIDHTTAEMNGRSDPGHVAAHNHIPPSDP